MVEEINRVISADDLFNALQEMARDKAPGSDSLTVEFYLNFLGCN